jgi:E3 ubiquitin-protein ligase HERC2
LQAYAQLKNVEAHKLFNRSKSWHVKFKNEEGIDSGGLFRESLTLICNDLQSNRLPIFIPCPNAQLADKAEGSGHNRNKWIPNPSCSHPRYQKLYEFVGRLLGLALWTDNTLPLDLPSFVWKPLLGQELCLEDLKDIDSYCGECLSFLTSDRDGDLTENNFNDIIFEYFQTVLSDGTVVDLKPNGAEIPVTYANRLEYVSLVQKTRLRESAKQLQWLRQGLSQVVPVGALSLLSWSELQDKVTGVPLIDIDLLRVRHQLCLLYPVLTLTYSNTPATSCSRKMTPPLSCSGRC